MTRTEAERIFKSGRELLKLEELRLRRAGHHVTFDHFEAKPSPTPEDPQGFTRERVQLFVLVRDRLEANCTAKDWQAEAFRLDGEFGQARAFGAWHLSLAFFMPAVDVVDAQVAA
jgi:hypothetical protein